MHIDAEHTHAHTHSHEHAHEHSHADGTTHTHAHTHEHEHGHEHPHAHEQLHESGAAHEHSHDCEGHCGQCASACKHTPMEELMALMQYMANHNAAHTRELADLAAQLESAGNHSAYEQVMAAVSDFEKGNLRLSAVLASLKE